MKVITLYRYLRPSGGITVSTEKPDCEYTTLVRLIADEGMLLTDGDISTQCVDVDNSDGWSEIVDPNPIMEEDQRYNL